MAPLKIITGRQNTILRKASEKVLKIDGRIKKLLKKMEQTMKKANGIGIAAPQIGENLRMCICLFNQGMPEQVLVPMINPEITDIAAEKIIQEEGCLSAPGIFGNVPRAKNLTVTFVNPQGKQQTLQLEGMNARIVQHELDHLEGTLCIDKFIKK